MATQYVDLPIEAATGVTSLNGMTGALTLVAGANITITPGVGTLTISAASAAAITSINGDTTTAQLLTVGTAGTDFAIVDAGAGSHVLNLPTASAVNRGALSSADWSTFNAKQPAGSYITALTGDGTAVGPGSAAFTLANTAVTPGSYTYASITVDSKGRLTAASSGAAPTGTVTSVALTAPGVLFSVSGSPVTTSGTLALSLVTQTANTVLAGPASGGAATPTFRALVSADLPNVSTTTKTTNYTILSTDGTIFCDTSGGAFNLTLPSPTALNGKIFRVVDSTGFFATNNLTLVPSGAEKISGLAANKALQTAWGFFTITTDGTDWFVG